MWNKNFLLRQSLSSTIKKLKSEWAPINSMSSNYSKVLENMKLWNNRFWDIFNLLDKIKKSIHNGEELNTIVIIRSDDFPEAMMDYIIMFMVTETAVFFAENGHLTLDIAKYMTWIWEDPYYNNKKILIADLRNLHIRKELDQEKYLLKLLQVTSKRMNSKLYNIIIIDESIKDLIQWNEYISTKIKNTILLR